MRSVIFLLGLGFLVQQYHLDMTPVQHITMMIFFAVLFMMDAYELSKK